MAIPDYQSLMLPLLKLISDGKEYAVRDMVQVLADQACLTAQERAELLPSGGTLTFHSRVGWAKTYMKKAGLLNQPKRGYIRITDAGIKTLKSSPAVINVKYLEQFPEFLAFRDSSVIHNTAQSIPLNSQASTPEELLEEAHGKITASLAGEILENLKQCSPSFFERLVVELLLAMGYGGTRADAGRAIGQSGDGGIDGIIDEDRLGLDAIYIQAKCWEGVVGRPEIQKFVGALQGQRAHKGVFITTSDFTKEAQEYVKNISNKVVLINGFSLARLMIENNVGVSIAATYEVKKVDSDYFVDE